MEDDVIPLQPDKNVLLVEDNDLNVKLFADLLEAHGYLTHQVRDGALAMAAVKTHQPKLIIMDIQLPNISGLDLIKMLKSDDAYRHIPIIAVTAFAMAEDEKAILQAGAERYMAKPISIASFVEAVQDYL
jgi:two-component system, cell cycle response regulator DivK